MWQQSILTIKQDLNLSELNLDGTHSLAKKGGQSVAYQRRKKGKTSNILPIMDANGYVVASTGIIAGNHNDAYNLKPHLQTAFKGMKRLGLDIHGAYFNADMAFDTREARKTCFNHGLIPNMPENPRNRKRTKRGRKRFFNAEVYQNRFCAERTFAWVDKFKRLLIRFERYDACFLGAHYIAFTMINLRHVLAEKSKWATTSQPCFSSIYCTYNSHRKRTPKLGRQFYYHIFLLLPLFTLRKVYMSS